MPLSASSRRKAPLASLRVWDLLRTHMSANSASSTSRTSSKRSSTASATSSGTLRSASLRESCSRLLGEFVSCRSTMARATAAGSASRSCPAGESAPSVRAAGWSGPTKPGAGFRDGNPAPLRRRLLEAVNGLQLRRFLGLGRGFDANAELFLDQALEFRRQLRVVAQEAAGVLHALAQLVAIVGEPGARLFDQAVLDTHVDDAALTGNALAVDDVELGDFEGRGHLVLDDFGLGAVADGIGALFQGLDAADVDADGGVELQRLTTGGGFRGAEEDTDLFTQLVDEDGRGLRLAQAAGDLTQGLAHQAGLQAHVAVAHVAFDFRAGNEGGHGVDDDDVKGAGPDKHVHDFQRLLAGVRLGDQERVGVDAQLGGIFRIEGVLGVDEGGNAALALGIGNRVQRDRGLTG